MTTKPAPTVDASLLPMLSDQALRLSGRKATGRLSAALADKLLGDAPPAMEELDGRRYPKGCEVVAVPALKAAEVARGVGDTDPFIPDHADVEYIARLEPRAMRRPMFIERSEFLAALIGQSGQAGVRTVFGPDDRRVYYSTAYPWRCVGKVETPLGSGSGVMVGQRHLLTCSHVID